MLAGPIFSRELVALPRRPKHFLSRAAFVAALLVLLSTAWQVLTGTQLIRNVGDLARFAAAVFQILAPLELLVCIFLAAISSALVVAQEKDRHTLVLLMLTNLSSFEIVVGQILRGIVGVLLLVLAAVPCFLLLALLGGIAPEQVAASVLVLAASVVLAGSLGVTLALWREKTFQTLALTVLVPIAWTAVWELAPRGAAADWATVLSPWRAMLEALRPASQLATGLGWRHPLLAFVVSTVVLDVLLAALSMARLRAWNTAPVRARMVRESANQPQVAEATHGASDRPVWNNPILWREVRTWAYGRRVIAIRLAYCALIAAGMWTLILPADQLVSLARVDAALRVGCLLVLSLLLINAQAVTSVTSERDNRALDLLLVTDLSPQEFIYGKLLGTFYNAKEMVLFPVGLAVYLGVVGALAWENAIFLLAGWVLFTAFATILGVHTAMAYASTRTAIAVSLGILFFLFIGVATCMRIMVAFSGSFSFQLQPFLAAMLGGFVGLYLALGARNPSPAITAAAFFCPLATLYALTSFLIGYTLAVWLVLMAAYGFLAAAMFVPAIHEFDVATARPGAGDDD